MPDFKPADPDFEQRVHKVFATQGFMRTLGAELVEVLPGAVAMRVAYTDGLNQHHGYFHGGVIGTLADNACGASAGTLVAADRLVLTVEYKLNFIAPADGEAIVARGRVVKPGRTLTTCAADIHSQNGGTETLVATALATMMTLPNPGAS